MEKVNFGYSLKNIPVHSNNLYLKTLIDKVSSFIKRIRWKAYFFDNPDQRKESRSGSNFGFKSDYSPPQSAALIPFENDMYELIRNISFKHKNNSFQSQLNKDAKAINDSKELLIPADKTTNLYKVTPQQYNKLLAENITKTYRKSDLNAIHNVNQEAKVIAKSFKLEDKIESYANKPAFITLKDHKKKFQKQS